MYRVLFSTLLCLVLAVPSGIAWTSYDGSEPDTKLDATSGYMFTDGPQQSLNRVYFNVVTTEERGPNANVGLLGSRLGTPGPQVAGRGVTFSSFEAMLGVWRDCNHDGYVGMGDGAMREYRIEASQAAGLPVDTVLCPPLADTSANRGVIFNGNGWITEMQPIGYNRDFNNNPKPVDTDFRVLSDIAAKVWGDPGVPTASAATATANPCAGFSVTPNRGGAERTGTWIASMDCHGNGPHALWVLATSQDPTGILATTVPDPAPLYASGGPLDKPTFGTDASCRGGDPQPCDNGSNAIVSGEQDCSRSPLVPTPDRPNSHPGQSGVRAPGAISINPSGTLPATVNETTEYTPLDDCDSTDDGGRTFYSVFENEGDGTVVAEKHRAGANFGYRPWNARFGCLGASKSVCGWPQDLGLPATYNPQGFGGNLWGSSPGQDFDAGGPTVDASRANIVALDVSPAHVWTFYAKTLLTSVSLPHPSDGVYGATQCSGGIGPGAPPANGWACDPMLWNQDGGVSDPDRQYQAAVGEAFQLMDVDCWDGRLVSAESGKSPTSGDIGLRSVPLLSDPAHACP